MKKTLTTSLFGLLIAILITSCATEPVATPQNNRWDTKHIPSEQFLLQRSYPDKQFDLRAYTRALEQARDQQSSGDRGIDAEWTVQGPGNIGGRVTSIAVHPTNENIIYAGFADGGVFKTTDGGNSWLPIFDDQLFLAIGTIVLDPVDPNTVYVGTGDPNISGLPSIGDGLYKSTDGGTNWTHLGLEAQRIISKVAIDPTDTDVLYVACMGLPFGPTPDRGVYKSTDGGQNWDQILYLSDTTGVIDMMMNPENPQVLYAAGWDRIRNNSRSLTSGKGARIYRTTDGGENWVKLENGLPGGEQSRIGLAMSGLNPEVVFAMVVNSNFNLEGIYKSTDSGDNWSAIPTDEYANNLDGGALGGFGWYFGKLRVNPKDDNDIYLLGIDLWRTTDNGNFWDQAAPQWWTYEVHADKHDLLFTVGGNLILGTDGGVYKSTDNADTWVDIENIPTTQFYRVGYNPHEPDFYYGGAQDNGTTGGNANDINAWPRIYGGDGFQPAFDPIDPMKMYAETQNGGLVFSVDGGYDWRFGQEGLSGDRRNWDMPYIISPHSNQVLYTGTYRAYRGATGADTLVWNVISDDLTEGTDDRYHTITTLDESPVLQGLLYYGAVDGYVNRRDPETGVWSSIAAGLPQRYVTDIKASPDFQDGVYITHSGYKDNDYIPHIHRSSDRGQNWEDISGDLPELAVNDIYILPNNQDSVLFAATDGGVYASLNRGQNWSRLGTGMPFIPVFDLELNVARNELIAGTFARSIMTFPLDSLGVSSDIMVAVNPVPLPARTFVKLSPNPTTDQIQIRYTNIEPGRNSAIAILDAAGKLVASRNNIQGREVTESFDVSSLPAGTYWVKVKMRHQVRTEAFVKG